MRNPRESPLSCRKRGGGQRRSHYSGATSAAKIPGSLSGAGEPCRHADADREHPQLLHHRPHRPREVHPGRPVPAQDRARSPSATSRPRRSTAWTWNASAASPSGCTRSRSTTSTTGSKYELNLIDTPGHVDFNYEVSRSLAACEGAILLVDAFQGVQAQTVANAFLAMDARPEDHPDAEQDRPAARPARTSSSARWKPALDDRPGRGACASAARPGIGIEEMLAAVIERVPPPSGDPDAPLKALIYNSHFDTYKGVVVYIRMMDGRIKPGRRSS